MLLFFLQIEADFQTNIPDYRLYCWHLEIHDLASFFPSSIPPGSLPTALTMRRVMGGRGEGPTLGKGCGPLYKTISKHLIESPHSENVCIFSEE